MQCGSRPNGSPLEVVQNQADASSQTVQVMGLGFGTRSRSQPDLLLPTCLPPGLSPTQLMEAPCHFTFWRMMWDMDALACTMMVPVLSSLISFNNGVGSRLSSSIRTERVSLEMRN